MGGLQLDYNQSPVTLSRKEFRMGSFNILHMEGIAGELKRAVIIQNEMKSGEGYSK